MKKILGLALALLLAYFVFVEVVFGGRASGIPLLGLVAIGAVIWALKTKSPPKLSVVSESLESRVAALETTVSQLSAEVTSLRQAGSTGLASTPEVAHAAIPSQAQIARTTYAVERDQYDPSQNAQVAAEETQESFSEVVSTPKGPSLFEQAKGWLFGGNTVARFGLLILFLGLIFLAKYAIDNDLFPIEARLALMGAIAFALLIFGWRFRRSHPSYGLLLQGGAVAALYLEVFAGYRFYHLISTVPAFVLMILVCALTVFLALRQNALILAVVASLGGFLTPILAASGSGNHVALFSIYAVLNLGIFYIARLKAWRLLFLVGFVMTFGISLIWTADRFRPGLLATSLPFIILFIGLYSLIPVFEARRAAPNIRHYVDGSLVFGVPITGFAILAMQLGHLEFGRAFAALGLGLWYVLLAAKGLRVKVAATETGDDAALHQRGISSVYLSYVGLGVGFASLAIPLALNPQLAGMAWAVEGVALIWLGLRNRQTFTRFSGCALQVLGLLIYFSKGLHAGSGPHFLNTFWLGALMLAASAYATGWLYQRARVAQSHHSDDSGSELPLQPQLNPGPISTLAATMASTWAGVERVFATFYPIVATALFGLSTTIEIDRALTGKPYGFAVLLVFWAVFAFALAWVGGRTQWKVLSRLGLLILPIQAFFVLWQWVAMGGSFEDGRWLAWPISMALAYGVLRMSATLEAQQERPREEQHEQQHEQQYEPLTKSSKVSLKAAFWTTLHATHSWLIGLLLAQAAQWLTLKFAKEPAWAVAAVGMVFVAILLALLRQKPSAKLVSAYRAQALRYWVPQGFAGLLGLWFVFACVSDYGGLAITPFMPLLNPIDLSAAFALLALLAFSRAPAFLDAEAIGARTSPLHVQIALSAAAFLWLNTVLMRSLSHYLHLDYRLEAMMHSPIAQTSFSLLWAIMATSMMVWSTRRLQRGGWLVGAALLAVVVLKLFLIDLSALSSITRIISFIGVGLLMLLIGYLSPLPPAKKA